MESACYSMILAIVRHGYADTVMNAARKEGARGGTVLNARGTGGADISKFLGVTIEPEREIILILARSDLRKAILEAIYEAAGLHTEANGLTVTLPF